MPSNAYRHQSAPTYEACHTTRLGPHRVCANVGKRRYKPEVLRRISVIKAAQKVGVSLEEIKQPLNRCLITAHPRWKMGSSFQSISLLELSSGVIETVNETAEKISASTAIEVPIQNFLSWRKPAKKEVMRGKFRFVMS